MGGRVSPLLHLSVRRALFFYMLCLPVNFTWHRRAHYCFSASCLWWSSSICFIFLYSKGVFSQKRHKLLLDSLCNVILHSLSSLIFWDNHQFHLSYWSVLRFMLCLQFLQCVACQRLFLLTGFMLAWFLFIYLLWTVEPTCLASVFFLAFWQFTVCVRRAPK